MHIQQSVDGLFMPKEIVSAFEGLRVIQALPNPGKELKNYLIIAAEPIDSNEFPSFINGESVSLEDYTETWDKFIKAVISWLRKNSRINLDLNLDQYTSERFVKGLITKNKN